MTKKRKSKKAILSQEEYDELLAQVEEFDDKSYAKLAQTKNYEIIPWTLEDGTIVGREDRNLMKLEVEKMGYKILYRVDNYNGDTLLINPATGKVMVLQESIQ